MTAGLAYAVLVEHLFDIGFVVNRAVVFAATSAIVIFAFIAIEWVLGKTTAQLGHGQSAAIELALAIVIGLSLRPIHARVDAFAEAIIFGARHFAANALVRFAEDCGEFRTRESLIAATLNVVRVYGRTLGCAIFLANEDGDLSFVAGEGIATARLDADDVSVVRMRTMRGILKRRSFPFLTVADMAFPMLRGRALAGTMFCTLPLRAEPYSPRSATQWRVSGAKSVRHWWHSKLQSRSG